MKTQRNTPCITLTLLMLSSISATLLTYDNINFYRATNLFPAARLDKEWLTSCDASISYGSTKDGRNACNKKTPFLDIYGTHNMHQVGTNVPGKNLSDVHDTILTKLSTLPAQETFGMFSIEGKFKLLEINASWTQNFTHGIFAFIHAPIRQIEIDNVCFNDLTPETGCPNKLTPEWQMFLNQFDAILKKYNLSKITDSKTSMGDLSAYIGWTHSYIDTETVDFIDTTLKIGALLPTGKEKNEDEIFSFANGYDGHFGIPFSADIAIGLYEWLTFGAHIDAIFFADTSKNIRMKTSIYQSGIIKLAKGCAKICRGTQWAASAFVLADKFTKNLSCTLGYSYASKGDDTIKPDGNCFDACIVNSDEMRKKWSMHTIHFFTEYDFTKEGNLFGPRIGLFYNLQVGGKRVFNTSMGGVSCGLEIACEF